MNPTFTADQTYMAATLARQAEQDRKSTRLNSSHSQISYAVFCLKKKKRRNRKAAPSRNPVTLDLSGRDHTVQVITALNALTATRLAETFSFPGSSETSRSYTSL